MKDRGFTSVTALLLLLFLSALGIALFLVVRQGFFLERKAGERMDRRKILAEEAMKVLNALTVTSSPEADSRTDEVWAEVEKAKEAGFQVELEDVSSKVNLNWVRKSVFEKTELNKLFKEGKSADELQQYREDKGFFLDAGKGFAEFFGEKDLRELFTTYGYANINTTDEFSLRKLYAFRTGKEAEAETFHGKIQGLLLEKKTLSSEDLRTFLGFDYEALYPIMNAEPAWNVHFLNQKILEAIISYPDFAIENPKNKARSLEDIREGKELALEDVAQVLGVTKDNKVMTYLGVKTWFWSLKVARGEGVYQVIVARVPGEKGEAPVFRIIEERD